MNQTFSGYAMSYKVVIDERKDLVLQLKASKLSIRNFFGDLLNETKGFKYQILLKKNTNLMEKLNLLQFILIDGQKQ